MTGPDFGRGLVATLIPPDQILSAAVQHQLPSPTHDYYRDRYWHEIPAVATHLNIKITGDPSHDWIDQALDDMGHPADRALILNCGNGHIERRLIDRGVIHSAVGIDISTDLLAEAEAHADGRPLEYVQLDVNTAEFPTPFDAVINVDACHHIACLDRVLRRCAELLPADGWFISRDYIGPHRNQYPYDQWAAAWELNEQLPEAMRLTLTYPHLPTMLAIDPTEAIHSELLLDTWSRYFTTKTYAPMGGAVAYLLLTHNDKVIDDPDPWADEITRILDADDDCGFPPLFAYWSGQPNGVALTDPRLANWTREENAREEAAARNGGEYYPRTALQALTLGLSDQTVAAQHARAWAGELDLERRRLAEEVALLEAELSKTRAHVAALEATWSWRLTTPLRRLREQLIR